MYACMYPHMCAYVYLSIPCIPDLEKKVLDKSKHQEWWLHIAFRDRMCHGKGSVQWPPGHGVPVSKIAPYLKYLSLLPSRWLEQHLPLSKRWLTCSGLTGKQVSSAVEHAVLPITWTGRLKCEALGEVTGKLKGRLNIQVLGAQRGTWPIQEWQSSRGKSLCLTTCLSAAARVVVAARACRQGSAVQPWKLKTPFLDTSRDLGRTPFLLRGADIERKW